MKTSLLSLFAGTVFLAGAAIASAGEPVTLASGQLDAVTAGRIDIDISRSAIAAVVQSLRQSNRASIDVDQRADVDVGIGTATVTQTSNNTISQSNTGTQTNSGAVTAASVN
jgi:hypothetical protein